ncbi:MAG: chromate efflux transporter [Acetobacteraceae bacterium]|nr:chromate efflux transporter [Acetobacteraceae bacterium]
MNETNAPDATGITTATDQMPSFAAAFRVWLKIGLLSFGGPAGQIALLHKEVVDDRHWIGERRFLHALSFCNLLPGPEAQQLATYLGWLMHGVKGGLAAGIIFVVPGAIVMLGLSLIYALAGEVPVVEAIFFGLKSAVLVFVVEAMLRIGRRALKGNVAWALAAAGFIALFFFHVPFPVVVLVSAAIGYFQPDHFSHGGHGQVKGDAPALIDAVLAADPGRPERLAVGARWASLAAAVLWLAPVAYLVLAVGGTFADVGLFFSKMAVVTIGGAYAVLAYVAQDAVEVYRWLSPAEMLAGLGLAETTPGPLILVLQFVGFLAGFRSPGAVTGVTGGILASVLTLWTTFAPCFVFVFLGAPLVERLASNKALSGALAAVTSAVVGVVANLAVWFALQVVFRDHTAFRAGPVAIDLPIPASIDLAALALAVVAALCLFRLKLGILRTLGITACLGLITRMVAHMI